MIRSEFINEPDNFFAGLSLKKIINLKRLGRKKSDNKSPQYEQSVQPDNLNMRCYPLQLLQRFRMNFAITQTTKKNLVLAG
jgi:hypothetical protein